MEEIILKLKPNEGNARQIIAVCSMEKAYKGLCYGYTAGLGDYTGPLGALMKASAPPEGKESALEAQTRQNCTRLCLQYLAKTLSGEELLGGEIPAEKLEELRPQVYEMLFSSPPEGYQHLLDFDAKAVVKALVHKQSKVLLQHAAALAQACNHCKLKSLDVSNISLGDDDAEGLAEILKQATTIERVDVSGNQIGNAGAQHLTGAILLNQTIKEVAVEDNLIGEDAIMLLKSAFEGR